MKISQILLFALVIPLFFSCSSKKDFTLSEKALAGTWVSFVNYDDMVGTDTLMFLSDGYMEMKQGVAYKGSDSGFDYRAKITSTIKGKWCLSGDTLKIMYDKSTISLKWIDSESDITLTDSQKDRSIPSEQKKMMLEDLKKVLETNYCNGFEAFDTTFLTLGTIEMVSEKLIEVANSGSKITLVKTE